MANFNFNKVILGGRLTDNVELKQTGTGVSFVNFSIAVNRPYAKNNDASQQNVDFINIVAWRQRAEFVSRYFKKGSSICIVGSLQTRSWTDQQVGTPVQPQRHMPRNGQYPADGASRQGNAPRQAGAPRQGNAPRQNSAPRQASAQRQNGAPRQNGAYRQEGVSSETRRYESVQPVHPQEVPKDVTKDLTRVKKAEAKAMKKAAAAEAKREQESRKAAQARAEEAKRQAQEAQRIEREQEAARKAQEEALEKAARQDAARHAGSAQGAADQGKNVKIDLIDL